jgi:hypothetical protein
MVKDPLPKMQATLKRQFCFLKIGFHAWLMAIAAVSTKHVTSILDQCSVDMLVAVDGVFEV